jgi:transcription antitermination factor NusA-like protein
MRFIRYLNLFEKITHVPVKSCFEYNSALIFAVPNSLQAKAIGENGKNIKQMSSILGKRIKIVPVVNNQSKSDSIEEFLLKVINPLMFNNIEISEYEVILTAGSRNKAALIGRNRRRFEELQKIVREHLHRELKIV